MPAPSPVWPFERAARIAALIERVVAIHDSWSRVRRRCTDKAERLKITARLRALDKRTRRLTTAAQAEAEGRPREES